MVGSLRTTVCTLHRFWRSRIEKSSSGGLQLVSISKSLSDYSVTVVAAFTQHFLRYLRTLRAFTKSDAKRDWMDYMRISEEISGLVRIASKTSIACSFLSTHWCFIPSCFTHLTDIWSSVFPVIYFYSIAHLSTCALTFDHQHFLQRVTIPSPYALLPTAIRFSRFLSNRSYSISYLSANLLPVGSPCFLRLVAIRSSLSFASLLFHSPSFFGCITIRFRGGMRNFVRTLIGRHRTLEV